MTEVYCFEGDETFLISQAVKKARRSYLSKDDELMNYEIIEDSDIGKIIISLSTPPFFGANRVIYVKNPLFLKPEKNKSYSKKVFLSKFTEMENELNNLFEIENDKMILKNSISLKQYSKEFQDFIEKKDSQFDKLLSVIKNSQNNIILIMALFGASSDKRKKNVKDLKKLAKVWQEFKQHKNKYPGQRDYDFEKWLQQQIQTKGYSLTNEALAFLSSIGGRDLGAFDNEIEKFITYVGDRKQIELADVKMMISYNELADFEMANAVKHRDKKKLLRLLHQVLRDDYGELMKSMGSISYQIRTLLKIKSLYNTGKKNSDIIAKELSIHPYVTKLMLAEINRYTLKQLMQILVAMHELDYKIRTGQGDGKLLLELLISKHF